MTKKEQSVVLYAEMLKTNPTPTRQQVIDMLVEKLSMTPAGASTYASGLRNTGNPTGTTKSKAPTTQAVDRAPREKKTQHAIDFTPAPETSKHDTRTLYTKVYGIGNEVVFSSSHFSKQDAVDFVPKSKYAINRTKGAESFIIIGVPTDSETVAQTKKNYKAAI